MTTLASWVTSRHFLLATSLLAALLATAGQANGQISGRPVAQPYFDYDWHARFDNCRWPPAYWGFDPYAVWDDDCDEETGECRSGFIAHRPNDWYVAADFLPLTYDPYYDVELARFGPAGPTALSTSDLDQEFDSGMRIVVGRTIWGCYQLEGAYQGSYSWADAAAVSDPGGTLSSFLSGFAADAGTSASTSIYTAMQTAEFNARAWLDLPPGPFDVSVLLGVRYMNIDETFSFGFDGATDPAIVQTENNLWGVQLGIDLKWLVHPRAYVDFDAKGAMCNNDLSASIRDAGAAPRFAFDDKTAFLGDLVLTLNWQVTPSWSIRAGYQAIFLTGLALGPDNLQANRDFLAAGPVQLDDRREAVFHGPVLGVMWAR
jgi:hypothetical protein